ncbi:suppressor of fused domain protein [Paenibacillus sp. YPG26]|uniref:suppressor of fused domain protein n=1 Tax=Paenibacillus sp. YPG26 TaxID=2878915 RepID=UPI00203FB611|nr:suppressor of fused domain protein [Paenibacillus sp. YPG26]USB32980.1 suppressor of fused domain protein [Paenibacillus sp. YPG26]
MSREEHELEDNQAPGWDAIDAQMERIYGDQEPKHYGTLIPYMLGGQDPLNGISAYVQNEPVSHWHFVTYGFSELYEKESEDTEYSGYGFELTFRLLKEQNESEPPAWALNLLQNLGRYVFGSGNIFRSGDYMDANSPIALEHDTQLTALAFIDDPDLPEITTPNGKVSFLQMVGITRDELEAMQAWNTIGVLREASESGRLPLYVTDLSRPSLLSDSQLCEKIRLCAARDGSSTGFLFVDQLEWEERKGLLRGVSYHLSLGAKQASVISQVLPGRLLKGNPLTLSSSGNRVTFYPGGDSDVTVQDSGIDLTLSKDAVQELADRLEPVAQEFKLNAFRGLTVKIVRTEITDQDGQVVETIG